MYDTKTYGTTNIKYVVSTAGPTGCTVLLTVHHNMSAQQDQQDALFC
jgi:hypothetical protein